MTETTPYILRYVPYVAIISVSGASRTLRRMVYSILPKNIRWNSGIWEMCFSNVRGFGCGVVVLRLGCSRYIMIISLPSFITSTWVESGSVHEKSVTRTLVTRVLDSNLYFRFMCRFQTYEPYTVHCQSLFFVIHFHNLQFRIRVMSWRDTDVRCCMSWRHRIQTCFWSRCWFGKRRVICRNLCPF